MKLVTCKWWSVEYADDDENVWREFWRLISFPKSDKIDSKSLGNENMKFEKTSENRRKRHQCGRNSYQFLFHSDENKINANKLTWKVKMLNENVDIHTCSWSCWLFKPIGRAVAVITRVIWVDSWQFINIKSTAVANTDEGWVLTAPPVSCKTHFTQNSAIWHGGMSSTEPTRTRRTTVTLINTSISHLSSCLPTKTVPAKQFGSVIAIPQNTLVKCHCSIGII